MKIQIIVVFIAIASLILIAGHAALYFSWLHFFDITSASLKETLSITLGALSISFVVTSLLAYWRENVVTSTLYFLASLWLGALLYLVLAMAGTWVVLLLGRLFGLVAKMEFIAGLGVGAAIAYSGYGVWNAWRPGLREIKITIKNLPPSWHGRTAVQISDVHLGALNRRGFLKRLLATINGLGPDIIFITGDFFDDTAFSESGQKLKALTRPVRDLRPALGTYFISGNHETYFHLERAMEALKEVGVTILRDELTEVDGIQLLGIEYPRLGQKKNFAAILQKLDRTKPNIVLYHEPTHLDIFKNAGTNLLLAGHTHVGQLWPFNFITKKMYHGYDVGLHRDGNMTVYTSAGVGTWGPPMRTGNRPEVVKIVFE